MSEPLLQVKDLKVYFYVPEGTVRAVRGVSWDLYPGETLGLVGESGCGKSVTALSLLRLIPNPPGKIVEGEIIFDGEDLLKKSMSEMRDIRGNKIAMIFQEPMTSLNPVLTIGSQITEVLDIHLNISKDDKLARAVELLEVVGIPDPAARLNDYPHQFSGGMRQRAMIAMALACNPKILLADEPTTALDVTIQAQILDVINESTKKVGTSVVLITHNLGVVARYADRVNVMYAGQIIEKGTSEQIFANPLHAYTKGLMASVPRLDNVEKTRLNTIEGQPPLLLREIDGCAFAPRNPNREHCLVDTQPVLEEKEPGHWVANCPGCLM